MWKFVIIGLSAFGLIGIITMAAGFVTITSSTQNFYASKQRYAECAKLMNEGKHRSAAQLLEDAVSHDHKFFYLKGVNDYLLGDYEACVRDLHEYTKEADVNELRTNHAIILSALAYRHLGNGAKSLSLLYWWQKYEKVGRWPTPILKQLRNEIGVSEVLRDAKTEARVNEAKAYLGIAALTSGFKDRGRELLRSVKPLERDVDLSDAYLNEESLNSMVVQQLRSAELAKLDK